MGSDYYLFEEFRQLDFILSISQISLDLSVSIVNDSQEHVEKDEEDKEHKEDEVDRT